MSSADCIHVTNREFLLALFGESLNTGALAWVCVFAQDPSKAKAAWKGQSWTPTGGGDFPANISESDFMGNCYFSLSTFTSDTGGRKTNNAAGCHAIILDDVGTKAAIGENLPEPTWVIETSRDNYQYGYAFDEPIRDLKNAQDFFKQLAQKRGITDPGGQGVVRYARLPNGFNTKSKYRNEDGTYPKSRLIVWNPGLRYSSEKLSQLLGINLVSGKVQATFNENINPVFMASDELNPVLKQLQERGLYKSEIGAGVHTITCPWVSEHTDELDNGTVYFEPSEEYELGGFKCHHGHCDHRRGKDLFDFLEVTVQAARNPILST